MGLTDLVNVCMTFHLYRVIKPVIIDWNRFPRKPRFSLSFSGNRICFLISNSISGLSTTHHSRASKHRRSGHPVRRDNLPAARIQSAAALNLVLDFDFIEQGAQYGAPKYMEWYGAFGLMVTLIWLYIGILHLLAKLQNRR